MDDSNHTTFPLGNKHCACAVTWPIMEELKWFAILKSLTTILVNCHIQGATTNINPCLGSKEFCRQKFHFSFIKKWNIRQKFANYPEFCQFSPPATVFNLFYEVLRKHFEAWLVLCSKKLKTRDCWIFGILKSCYFCLQSHFELENADYYILECHMVKFIT